MEKPMTQFHEKMSKDGHKVISKSALCSKAMNEGMFKLFHVLNCKQKNFKKQCIKILLEIITFQLYAKTIYRRSSQFGVYWENIKTADFEIANIKEALRKV